MTQEHTTQDGKGVFKDKDKYGGRSDETENGTKYDDHMFDQMPADKQFEMQLRPRYFDEFIGQRSIVDTLRDYKINFQLDKKPDGHILFTGGPGRGKTSMARCLSNELGSDIIEVHGPNIKSVDDVIKLLKRVKFGDVVFVDEIQAVYGKIQTFLNPVLEDFFFTDIRYATKLNPTGRWEIPPFIFIGATTEEDLIKGPLSDRFNWTLEFELYGLEDMIKIVDRTFNVLKIPVVGDAVDALAFRARGTPRIANRFCRWCKVYTRARGINTVTLDVAESALDQYGGLDQMGCSPVDRNIMKFVVEKYKTGPVGIDVIATALDKSVKSIKNYEKYLFKIGFMTRKGAKLGREVTQAAVDYYGWIPGGESNVGGKSVVDRKGERSSHQKWGEREGDINWDEHMTDLLNKRKEEKEKEETDQR